MGSSRTGWAVGTGGWSSGALGIEDALRGEDCSLTLSPVTSGMTRRSVEVRGSKSGAASPADSGPSVEDLHALRRVPRAGGLGTGWSGPAEGWLLGVMGILASGVLTEDLSVLPCEEGSGAAGCSVEVGGWSSGPVGTPGSGVLTDLLDLPLEVRDVRLRAAGCSVEVRGWSSGPVGTPGSGVLREDLLGLPRVALVLGITGCSTEVRGWSSGQAGTTASGVLREDLRDLPRDVGLGMTGCSVEVEG